MFFHDVELDDPEYDQYECFLQLSAQIMAERGYEFYYVNTTKEVKLRKQEGEFICDRGDDMTISSLLQKFKRARMLCMCTQMATKSSIMACATQACSSLGLWM